jgi:hypothetical protein
MEPNELTPKPKKRKAKPAPQKNGHKNGRDHGERTTEETRPKTVSSGNVAVKIWANRIPGGGYSYRFRFCRLSYWELDKFDGEDVVDAILAARKAKRWILGHRWRTFFGFRK